jgi:hypothetical protein
MTNVGTPTELLGEFPGVSEGEIAVGDGEVITLGASKEKVYVPSSGMSLSVSSEYETV